LISSKNSASGEERERGKKWRETSTKEKESGEIPRCGESRNSQKLYWGIHVPGARRKNNDKSNE
jgi:hypothetical protein